MARRMPALDDRGATIKAKEPSILDAIAAGSGHVQLLIPPIIEEHAGRAPRTYGKPRVTRAAQCPEISNLLSGSSGRLTK
jgi:hypothetical protein